MGMEHYINDKLVKLEHELKQAGFHDDFVQSIVEQIEEDTYTIVGKQFADEHLINYFKFLESKIEFTKRELIDRRKKSENFQMWRSKTDIAGQRVDSIAPTKELAKITKQIFEYGLRM